MFLTLRHLANNLRKAEEMNRIVSDAVAVRAGEVDRLTVTVLLDYLAEGEDLRTENGVSYLIEAGEGPGILFDVGFNRKGEEPSPLLHNMSRLGVGPESFDAIVISHKHLDHVGGLMNQLMGRFSISKTPLNLEHVTAFTPEPLTHPSARVEVNHAARELRPGVVLGRPLPSSLFWLGRVPEQSLSITVAGLGQVVVVGCGHPGLRDIVEYFERAGAGPVAALVGGFHQMFRDPPRNHEGFTAMRQARRLGSARHPLDMTTCADVEQTAEAMVKAGVKYTALSPHDNCDGAMEVFRSVFEDGYTTLSVGKKLVFSAEGVSM